MSEEIKGKCYQEHEPTPNNPCEIKTILCNGIEIPVEFLKQNFVTVDGKKYIELQQENQELKSSIGYLEIALKERTEERDKHSLKEYLCKKVIEEAREYIDNNTELEHDGDDYGYTEWVNIKPQNIVFINELSQILDKVKEK